MCRASASGDTVINKSPLYVQSGLNIIIYVADVQKELITVHYIGLQDNNNFNFFPKGLGCSAIGKVTR